jgi:zinc protease
MCSDAHVPSVHAEDGGAGTTAGAKSRERLRSNPTHFPLADSAGSRYRRSVLATLPSLALLTQLLAAPAAAAPPAAPPASAPAALFPFEVDTLDNGLTLVTVPTGPSGTVAYYTLVKAGSRDEVEPGKSGYAHLFEHLMFRGTKAVPAAAYEKKMQALGADANAFTTDDFTLYVPTIPKDSLGELVPLEADRFMRLDVAEAPYKDETGAVLGEFNKDAANPIFKMDEAMRELAFTKHTYGHTTIGYERDVRAMPASHAYSKSFFARFYTPDDCVIFAVGDVKHDDVLARVKQEYAGWKGKRATTATVVEPEQTAPRLKELTWTGPTPPRMFVAYKVPAATNLDDVAAMAVLTTLLLGEPGALYQRLVVKEQKLLSLAADPDDAMHKDPGLLPIAATLKPDATSFEVIGAAIQAAFDGVAKGGASPAEVAAARAHVKNALLLSMQTPGSIAVNLAAFTARTGDVHALDRYVAALARVTPDDLARVAKAYFTPARRTTITLSPPPPTVKPEPSTVPATKKFGGV